MPCDYKIVVYVTSNSAAYLGSQTAHGPPVLPASSDKSSPTGNWNTHGKPNAGEKKSTLLFKAARPRYRTSCNQAIPPLQQQRTHTADAKHPAGCFKPRPPESVTLYVSKPLLKNLGIVEKTVYSTVSVERRQHAKFSPGSCQLCHQPPCSTDLGNSNPSVFSMPCAMQSCPTEHSRPCIISCMHSQIQIPYSIQRTTSCRHTAYMCLLIRPHSQTPNNLLASPSASYLIDLPAPIAIIPPVSHTPYT